MIKITGSFLFMIRYSVIITLLLCALCSEAQQADLLKQTNAIIRYLQYREFDQVYQLLDPATMQRQISADELEMMWDGFIEKYDSIQTVHEPDVKKKDTLWVSETKIDFVKKSFILQLSFNKEGVICGLFLRNINLPYSPPAYVNTLSFYEQKLTIAAKGIVNEGVLSVPKTSSMPPLVIIVGGSGPTSMDATSGSNKPYKDLAWGLASKGVAVYRYNKRTCNKENLIKQDLLTFGLKEEYADDLKALIQYFQRSGKIDPERIYILGHSQGGFMLPYFAKENNSKIKGYISLAGNFSTIAEMLPYQFRYLQSLSSDTAVVQAYNAYIAKAGYMQRNATNPKASPDSMISGMTVHYMLDMEKNKPANLVKYISAKPVLLIQGGRDYQVPVTELELWKNALRNSCCATFKTFDKLNHLMLEGEGISGPAEYSIPSNIPEYVPGLISEWILQQK